MNISDLLSIGYALMGGIGYGLAVLFLLAATLAFLSALFRTRTQESFNRRMDTFAIGAIAAFVLALITTVCLKLIS